MISYLPLNSHQKPKRVLIIGGGDGGVVREVVKHPDVEEVIMCEIDEAVVDVSKRFLPFMSGAFDSPKLKLLFEDGYEFVKRHQNQFDVIITDSSDPKGPAECLFQEPYYRALHDLLEVEESSAVRPSPIGLTWISSKSCIANAKPSSHRWPTGPHLCRPILRDK